MTPTRDDSIPADTAAEGCRIEIDASSSPLCEWTEVRVASIEAQGADRGVERCVSAMEVSDATIPSTWQIMLAATGWTARLGLGVREALPLVVTLPSGYALPLAVGDVVTLRAFHAVDLEKVTR